MSKLTVKQAWLVLNGLPHVGPVLLKQLLEHFDGDPLQLLAAPRGQLLEFPKIGPVIANSIVKWRDNFDLAGEEQAMEKRSIHFVASCEQAYPSLLKEIYDPPAGLYVNGTLSVCPAYVAIVGSRRCSVYGVNIARQLARDLATRGYCIISGMARGIDTAAHEGALEAGGQTIAVLGCGIDIIYPPENYDLYRDISDKGAVVSEFPFGRRAGKQTFPMRNRLISGMSQAVIVVESAVSGGSMITARFAGEQGRPVFAVPGRIDQSSSMGCHQLIRDGAILLTNAAELIADMSYSLQSELEIELDTKSEKLLTQDMKLEEDELSVYKHLASGESYSIDKLLKLSDLPIQRVAGSLLTLEIKNCIIKKIDGTYERT